MNQKVIMVSRILLGLIFIIFGSNGLMMVLTGAGFIPMPPPKPEVMEAMGGFFKIGYLMPLVKSMQVIAGLLLLSNKFLNFAITLLGPIIVNIVCVHIFIDTSGLAMAVFILILFSLLVKARWNDFHIIFRK